MSSILFKLRKYISAIMAVVCVAFCFTGCDKGEEESEISEESSEVEEDPKTIHKVGFIYYDEVDDDTFSTDMNKQRIMAANRSNIETCYIDNVSISDFEMAVVKLISVGCTDIVSGSAVFSHMLDSISNKYMNVNFIAYGTTGGGANISSYTEQPYQGAYAAGVCAAYNSFTRKIGIVVDSDMLYSIAVVNAAALGTQAVFDTAKLYVVNATADSEIKRAVNTLKDYGCDVVICYTSSAKAEDYCQTSGIKFIGCHNFEENEADYPKMLMYFYTRRDSYFLAQFKQMQLDTWQPDVYTGNMGNGIVCISEALAANKDRQCQKVLDAIVPLLSNGGEIFKGQLIDNKGIPRYLQTDVMTEREIYSMAWYVQGVEIVGNYREPKYIIPDNDFEVET